MILHHSDDLLAASHPKHHQLDFIDKLRQRFTIEHQEQADWYLRARIRRDKDGNIYVDQQRYSKAIVNRYLSAADPTPSPQDILKYASPQPTTMVWTKADNSANYEELNNLESEYGIRFIEATGSLNYLSNSHFKAIYTSRKCCKHMHLPGRKHFKALIHYLHHIRCHPPGAMVYYHEPKHSPLAALLNDAGHSSIDPSFVYFSDSSHADCDEARSTGCYAGLIHGGLVDFSSFVPTPIASSSAESESNALCVATLCANYARQVYCDIVYNNSSQPFTVPIFIDSSAAEAITKNDKDTHRTKHIERRWLIHRKHRQAGLIDVLHVNGNAHNIADLGTKPSPINSESKISVIEHPVDDFAISPRRN